MKKASWVQLICWIVFLLITVVARVFFQVPPNSNSLDANFDKFMYTLFVYISATGVWTSILAVLAVRRIDHPLHDDGFNKLLKFAAVMLHFSFYGFLFMLFIVFTPLAMVMPLLWAVSMIICTGLLIVSKGKREKAAKESM